MGSLTDIKGITVGHWTDTQAITGCTVVLCPEGAVAGGDVRGSAPGTRETDLLRPMHLVQQAHAIVLSGGSAFGLDAATGVMRFLEERGYGFPTSAAKVPIVPAAILYDLGIGSSRVRPGAEQGYLACLAAGVEMAEGSVGAGTGATVGKILGMERATKGGLGTASQRLNSGLIVAALMAVNAVGDVVNPRTGKILAGPREGKKFLNTVELMKQNPSGHPVPTPAAQNTTIGVVATNAALTKEMANKMAQMAHDGLARAVHPCHTMYDGDVIFALSLGDKEGNISLLGAMAAEVVAEAIVRAVTSARGLGGVPAASEIGDIG